VTDKSAPVLARISHQGARSSRSDEYKKNKRPVTRISTVFTQSVIAIHSARMTNSFPIPPSSQ